MGKVSVSFHVRAIANLGVHLAVWQRLGLGFKLDYGLGLWLVLGLSN
jgi:hypothetical protein